jgi:hypothetical protein
MKASSRTVTKVRVHISTEELIECVRRAGIHIPEGAGVDVYGAPFDDETEGDGVLLEWSQVHAENEQG